MKLSTARQAYYDATTTVSTQVRQLAFAGIAVVWIFRQGSDGSADFSLFQNLVPALFLFVLALLLDLLQFVYKSIVWGWFARKKEKEHKLRVEEVSKAVLISDLPVEESTALKEGDVEFDDPNPAINYLAIALFWMKCMLLAVGYCLLVFHFWKLVDLHP